MGGASCPRPDHPRMNVPLKHLLAESFIHPFIVLAIVLYTRHRVLQKRPIRGRHNPLHLQVGLVHCDVHIISIETWDGARPYDARESIGTVHAPPLSNSRGEWIFNARLEW